MMIPQLKTLISKTILILIGIVLLSYYIWFRFIRERLPRVIPFELTIYGFLILVWICSIYVYIIISTLFDYTPQSSVLSKGISYIFKPLIALDEAIKTNTIIKPYYERLLLYITTIKDTNYRLYRRLYYLFDITPRVIIVSALLIDTFYFHCLFLLYKVIIVSSLLLIARYIKYSLTYAKEQYTLQLEPMVHYIVSNYEDPTDELAGVCLSALSVRRFIDIQTDAIVYSYKEYTSYPFGSTSYMRKLHNVPPTYEFIPEDGNLIQEYIDLIKLDFDRIMKIVIPLSVHLEEYSVQTEYKLFKKRKSIIFILFLISWSYILYVSYNPMLFEQYEIPYIECIEPFSGLPLTYEYTDNNVLQNILSFLYEHLLKDILYDIVNKEEPFSGNDI
jgi:hypothetical protein